MGLVLFLFHYAKDTNNQSIYDLANIFLDKVFEKIDASVSIDFHSGLCGIGWGLEYLVQNKMIDVDTNEILEDVDKKINSINPERIDDLNLNHGLGGIIHYLIARSQSKTNNNKGYIYTEPFFRKSLSLLAQRTMSTDSLDVFLRFIRLHEKTNFDLDGFNLSIYDLLYLPDNIDNLDSDKLGLDGIAGFGLNLIWNKTYGCTVIPSGYYPNIENKIEGDMDI